MSGIYLGESYIGAYAIDDGTVYTQSLSGSINNIASDLSLIKILIKSLAGAMGSMSGSVSYIHGITYIKSLTGSIGSLAAGLVSTNVTITRDAIMKAGKVVSRLIKGGRA